MKTIRQSVFETNSSSMHAIVIPKSMHGHKTDLKQLEIKYNMDFSDRCLIVHNNPEDKASYIFQIVVKQFISHFKPVDGSLETEEHNEFVFRTFKAWMDGFKGCAKKWRNIDVEFTGFELKREYTSYSGIVQKAYDIVAPSGTYASTGCYGFDALNAVLMPNMLKKIDDSINGHDMSYFIKLQPDYWDFDMINILDFVLDPVATIIQCTDEYTDDEFRDMKNTIRDCAERSDYYCDIIWPAGG